MEQKETMPQLLSKQEYAMLYRALRDKVIAQGQDATTQEEFTVLGKLKVILNLYNV